MPPNNHYICSVCKNVHRGPNCWSTDSDEEIDSGLLQAMKTLVPKEVPEIVDIPGQESQSQSILSTESWERGESSSLQDERIPTTSIHRQGTAPLSSPRQENKAPFINAVVPDANAYGQQTFNANSAPPHRRNDSGNQEWQRSNEHQRPTTTDYAYSQISAVPPPLRIPGRQAQRRRDSQHGRSDEYEQSGRNVQQQPDSQPRRSDEQRPQTDCDRSHTPQYQQESREESMAPPPPRTGLQQYPSQTSRKRNNRPHIPRTSQEAMDRAARQRRDAQPNRGNNPQPTPTFTQPRAPPVVPTGPGPQRIQLSRKDSGDTHLGQFMEEGKTQYPDQRHGWERSNTQQRQRTSEENRQCSDPRVRDDNSCNTGGLAIDHAQTRSQSSLEENERPVTEFGDFKFADRMLTQECERERGDTQQRQRRSEEDRQRDDTQYYPGASNKTPRPIGNLQKQFKKEWEEEAAYNATRRDRDSKRQHGSGRRREQDTTHQSHRRPEAPRERSGTPRHQEKTMAEEAAAAAYLLDMQRQQSSSSRRREDGTSYGSHQNFNPSEYSHIGKEDRYSLQQHPHRPTSQQTLHARAVMKEYYHHDRQVEEGTIARSEVIFVDSNPPGDLDHPSYKNVLYYPVLSHKYFFRSKTIISATVEGERRQTHWECALNRLEGRIPDEDVEGDWKRAFLEDNPWCRPQTFMG